MIAYAGAWRVTASEIHNNPLKKVYTCQVLAETQD
jgi:hypothetical protein